MIRVGGACCNQEGPRNGGRQGGSERPVWSWMTGQKDAAPPASGPPKAGEGQDLILDSRFSSSHHLIDSHLEPPGQASPATPGDTHARLLTSRTITILLRYSSCRRRVLLLSVFPSITCVLPTWGACGGPVCWARGSTGPRRWGSSWMARHREGTGELCIVTLT